MQPVTIVIRLNSVGTFVMYSVEGCEHRVKYNVESESQEGICHGYVTAQAEESDGSAA